MIFQKLFSLENEYINGVAFLIIVNVALAELSFIVILSMDEFPILLLFEMPLFITKINKV